MGQRPSRVTRLDEMTTTFGDIAVTADQRRDAVGALFDRVAPRYDLMNDLMSFGTHRLWKRHMVRAALERLIGRNGPIVDVAGGTGDIALAIKAADPDRDVIVSDASAGMLEVARQRGKDTLEYVQSPAEEMPFETDSAAAVTLAFGLRNMTDPAGALRDCARILQPGASLLLLEFSKPQAWFAPFYGLHARYVIPALGSLIARDKRAYRYLVDSIERFPGADDISRELDSAGFDVVAARPFMFGVASLHIAKARG